MDLKRICLSSHVPPRVPPRVSVVPAIDYIALISAVLNSLRFNIDVIESFMARIDAIGLVSLFVSCSQLYNRFIRDADPRFDIARLALDHFYGYLSDLKVADRTNRRRSVTVGRGARAFSLLQHLAIGNEALDRRVLNYANRVLEGCGSLFMHSTQHMHHYMYDFLFRYPMARRGSFALEFGLTSDRSRGARYPYESRASRILFNTAFGDADEFFVAGSRQKTRLENRFYGIVRTVDDPETMYIIRIDMTKFYASGTLMIDIDLSAPDVNHDWISVQKVIVPGIQVEDDTEMGNFWLAGRYLAQRIDDSTVITMDLESGSMFTMRFGASGHLFWREMADKPADAGKGVCFFDNEPCFVYDHQFSQQKSRRRRKKLLLPFPTAK